MNDHNDFRLTDDLERRLVRQMAREQLSSGSIRHDVTSSIRHGISAVRKLIDEVNVRMDRIGEARYS